MKKGKRGAPLGNQNARKHGFYSRVLNEAEQIELSVALDVEGLDQEIALLRLKIQSLLEKDPENIKLMLLASSTLARLMRTRYQLTKDQDKGLKEAITNVLREVAIPLGLGAVLGFKELQ